MNDFEGIARALASRDEDTLVAAVLDRRASPEVLRVAAIALGNLGGPRAFERLATLLRHRDPVVRLGAIEGLAILRDARAVAPLTELLDDAATAWPQEAGVKAGGYAIGKEAARAIREIRGGGGE